MPFPPDHVADLISEVGFSRLEWHDEIGSTNATALERVAAGEEAGLVVGAEVQTAGRGRRGRSWHAPAGSSLTLSVLLRPALPQPTWPVLTLAAGVAVARAAAVFCAEDSVALKWPNDLLIDGVKAAGVLAESAAGAVVIGIGLNVDWRGVPRPDGVEATSLAEAAGTGVDRADALVALLRHLGAEFAAATVDPGGVVARYAPLCATIGSRVTALGAPGAKGVAIGVAPGGQLRIRTDAGRVVEVGSGEVEHLR